MKKAYGLTIEDLAEMLECQNSCCAICGNEFPYGMNGLSIDHDHSTGMVRALLCVPCNLILGNAKESVQVLNSAIEYLEAWND